jgi:hypothetical protein
VARYQFGEIFSRLGIPNKGRQGETWCALDPEGIMVLVAHQVFFHRVDGRWIYETPNHGPMPVRGPSAMRSLRMLAEYFEPERPILLPVAVFDSDGGKRPDGTWAPSQFNHATGDVYRGRMKVFRQDSGYLLCELDSKFPV